MEEATDELQARALNVLYKAQFTGEEARTLLHISREKQEELWNMEDNRKRENLNKGRI
jgi:hypothetical protein